eukprot:tig00021582_g22621.t2
MASSSPRPSAALCADLCALEADLGDPRLAAFLAELSKRGVQLRPRPSQRIFFVCTSVRSVQNQDFVNELMAAISNAHCFVIMLEDENLVLQNAPGLSMRISGINFTKLYEFGLPGVPGYSGRVDAFERALREASAKPPPTTEGEQQECRTGTAPGERRPRAWPSQAPVRVFISYSRSDSNNMARIKSELERQDPGAHFWLDVEQLEDGDRWVDEIARGIEGSTHLLFFASRRSAASQYCGEEFHYAYSGNKRIVICYLEPRLAVFDSLPRGLRMRWPSCSDYERSEGESSTCTASALSRLLNSRDPVTSSIIPKNTCTNCAVENDVEPQGDGPDCDVCRRPLAVRGDMRFSEIFGPDVRPEGGLEHLIQQHRERPSRAAAKRHRKPRARLEVFKRAGLCRRQENDREAPPDPWRAAQRALAYAAWFRCYGVPTLWDACAERNAVVKTRVRGESVQQVLSRRSRCDVEDVLCFLEQMSFILHHIHTDAELAHERISPSAVLMSRSPFDGCPQYMLEDLGLARRLKDASLERPAFDAAADIAPSTGVCDDVYAVGRIALSMLSGCRSLRMAGEQRDAEEIRNAIQHVRDTRSDIRSCPVVLGVLSRILRVSEPNVSSAAELWASLYISGLLPRRDFEANERPAVRESVQKLRKELKDMADAAAAAASKQRSFLSSILFRSPSGPPVSAESLFHTTEVVSIKGTSPAALVDPFGVMKLALGAAKCAILPYFKNLSHSFYTLATRSQSRSLSQAVQRIAEGSFIVDLAIPRWAAEGLKLLDKQGAEALARCGVLEIQFGALTLNFPEVSGELCPLTWGSDAFVLSGFLADAADRYADLEERLDRALTIPLSSSKALGLDVQGTPSKPIISRGLEPESLLWESLLQSADPEKSSSAVELQLQLHPPGPDADGRLDAAILGEIDPQLLAVGEKLGRRSSGTVYKGEYMQEAVAVKEFFEYYNAEFGTELFVQFSLRHARVVQLKGAQTQQLPLRIVMERMDGNLRSAVLNQPEIELSLADRLRIMREICEGLCALHGAAQPVVHGNLKSLEVLVKKEEQKPSHLTCKISGFGLATIAQPQADNELDPSSAQPERHISPCRGSFPWMAPEVMAGQTPAAASDVYSFATVCWEVLTRQLPHAGLRREEIVGRVLGEAGQEGSLPHPIPPDCPEALRELLARCWSRDPSGRPTAGKAYRILRQLDDDARQQSSSIKSHAASFLRDRLAFGNSAEGVRVRAARLRAVAEEFVRSPQAEKLLTAFVADVQRRMTDEKEDDRDALQRELRVLEMLPQVVRLWARCLDAPSGAGPEGPRWSRAALLGVAGEEFGFASLADDKFRDLLAVAELPQQEAYTADQLRDFCFWLLPTARKYRQLEDLFLRGPKHSLYIGDAFLSLEMAERRIADQTPGTFVLRLSSRPWPNEYAGDPIVTYKCPMDEQVVHARVPPFYSHEEVMIFVNSGLHGLLRFRSLPQIEASTYVEAVKGAGAQAQATRQMKLEEAGFERDYLPSSASPAPPSPADILIMDAAGSIVDPAFAATESLAAASDHEESGLSGSSRSLYYSAPEVPVHAAAEPKPTVTFRFDPRAGRGSDRELLPHELTGDALARGVAFAVRAVLELDAATGACQVLPLAHLLAEPARWVTSPGFVYVPLELDAASGEADAPASAGAAPAATPASASSGAAPAAPGAAPAPPGAAPAAALLGVVIPTSPTCTGGASRSPLIDTTDVLVAAASIDRQHLHVNRSRVLGRGNFGDVYEGVYMHERVAVKEFKPDYYKFVSEFAIQFRQRHERIVQIKYACMEPPVQIVMERMDGDLRKGVLARVEDVPLGFQDRLRVMREVCEGLCALHGAREPVVHGDVKSLNVLVRWEGRDRFACKLGDFGLARLAAEGGSGGTGFWAAPEVLAFDERDEAGAVPCTAASDVYSFATVCWEVLTRQLPFNGDSRVFYQRVRGIVERGEPPHPLPVECPQPLKELLLRCWQVDPARRPTAAGARDELVQIEAAARSSALRLIDEDVEGYLRERAGPGETAAHGRAQRLLEVAKRYARGRMSGELLHTFVARLLARLPTAASAEGTETEEEWKEKRAIRLLPEVVQLWERVMDTPVEAEAGRGGAGGAPPRWPRAALLAAAEREFQLPRITDEQFAKIFDLLEREGLRGTGGKSAYTREEVMLFCCWVLPASRTYKEMMDVFRPGARNQLGDAFLSWQEAEGLLGVSPPGTFVLRLSGRPWPDESAGYVCVTFKNRAGELKHARMKPASSAHVRSYIQELSGAQAALASPYYAQKSPEVYVNVPGPAGID